MGVAQYAKAVMEEKSISLLKELKTSLLSSQSSMSPFNEQDTLHRKKTFIIDILSLNFRRNYLLFHLMWLKFLP